MNCLRFLNNTILQAFSPDTYIKDFQTYSKLIPVSEVGSDSDVSGYMPFYTVVYIRSTGNDVILNTSENKPKFYGVIRLPVQDLTTVMDEALLSAKYYLDTVITKQASEAAELPFKSFPLSRGGVIIAPNTDPLSDLSGAFIIMSVIIEEEYFAQLELKEGYAKMKFNPNDYTKGCRLTQKVAETFIKVHKPPVGGTL